MSMMHPTALTVVTVPVVEGGEVHEYIGIGVPRDTKPLTRDLAEMMLSQVVSPDSVIDPTTPPKVRDGEVIGSGWVLRTPEDSAESAANRLVTKMNDVGISVVRADLVDPMPIERVIDLAGPHVLAPPAEAYNLSVRSPVKRLRLAVMMT